MTSQRFNLIIGIIFLVVGIMSVVNTIRLNSYMSTTLPRDTAQEACQLATLQSLRVWAVGRSQIEEANEARDDAFRPVFLATEQGRPVSPEMAANLNQAYTNLDTVRHRVNRMLEATPIPNCKLSLNSYEEP